MRLKFELFELEPVELFEPLLEPLELPVDEPFVEPEPELAPPLALEPPDWFVFEELEPPFPLPVPPLVLPDG